MAAHPQKDSVKKPHSPHSGDVLRQLAFESRLTSKELADRLEISPQSLNNWFSRGVPAARVRDVARVLAVSEAILLGEAEFEDPAHSAAQDEDWKSASLAKSEGTVADYHKSILYFQILERQYLNHYFDHAEDRDFAQCLKIEKDWLIRHGLGQCHYLRLGVAIASGQQMLDTFRDGDLLLFELTLGDLPEDGVYLFYFGGVMTCRRLQLLPDEKILVITDSTAYRDQVVPASSLEIFARVRMVLNAKLL